MFSYPRVIVVEGGKEYVVSKRSDWAPWTCSCPMAMFKKKKCRHIFFVEVNNIVTEEKATYDPGLGDCGNKYVQHHFRPDEWTDPETALVYLLMREGAVAEAEAPGAVRKDWKKELDALRKRAPKKAKK